MAVEYDYDSLINGVVSEIKGVLAGGATVILIPPASSRGEIFKRLAEELPGLEILSYRKLHERTGVGKALEFKEGRLLVEGLSIVEYIKGGRRLSEVLDVRRVIVTESTVEALGIYHVLREELREELMEQGKPIKEAQNLAEEHVKKRVKICFPPSHYKEKIKLKDEVEKIVEVNYEDALKGLVENPRGISLKLLHKTGNKEKWDYVVRGVEAIRRLKPDKVGLKDTVLEAGRAALNALGAVVIAAPAYAFGGAFFASALATLAGFPEVLAHAVGVDIPKDSLKAFLARFFKGMRKREPKDPSLKQVASLLKSILAAEKYVGDDVFEGVVDEVAATWGLSIEEFRKFVENLRKMATERLVSEEELEKLRTLSDEEFRGKLDKLFEGGLDELREELEGRLNKIEEEMEELRKEVRTESVSPGATHFDGLPNVEVEDNVVKLRNVLLSYGGFVEYVHNPLEDAVLRKLAEAVWAGGRLVVLKGGKGIGKSTSALVALSRLLDRMISVYSEEEHALKVYKPVVVELSLGQDVDRSKLNAFVTKANKMGYMPVFYVDPSKTGHYPQAEKGWYIPEENFAARLSMAITVLREAYGTASLIVLSNDQYELVKFPLEGVEVIDADKELSSSKLEFLRGIVEKYSGCSGDVSGRLASLVAEEFSDSYTVAAVLAADWLGKGGCREDQVLSAIRQSQRRISEFVRSYIWYGLLGNDQRSRSENASRLAPLILATGLLGIFPKKLAVALLEAFGKRCEGVENDPALLWLTQNLHDTVRDAIEGMVEEVVDCVAKGRECDFMGDKPEHIITQLKNTIVEKNLGRSIGEIRKNLVGRLAEGIDRNKLFKAEVIDGIEQCRDDFAFIIGFAFTPYPIEDFINDLKCPSGLLSWLIVDNEMPFSARIFLSKKAEAFKDVIKPCSLLSSIYARANTEGGLSPRDAFITLGAFVASGGELANCLEEAAPLIHIFFQRTPVPIEYLDKAFTAFAEGLIRRGFNEWATAIAYIISGENCLLAEKILKRMDVSKLNWVARLYYEWAISEIIRELIPEMTREWMKRVLPLVERECANASCLYTKAVLGACLAYAIAMIRGSAEALKWIEEALRAVKELEKRDNLAEELAPLLRIEGPFEGPKEVAENILIKLKGFVLDTAALLALSLDVGMALKYAEEAYRIAVSPQQSVASYDRLAKTMFLKGKPEAVEAFRENMKRLQREVFLGFETISRIVAEYIASFLAEGDVERALREYNRHRRLINDYRTRAILLGLLFAHGLDVEKEFENARRPAFVREAPGLLKGVLAYLYGFVRREEACEGFKGKGRRVCKKILEAVNKPELLRKLLRDREEELLLEELSDPLEVLEITIAMMIGIVAFLEIMRFIRTGRIDIAKKLAEHWQEICEERQEGVLASLFGDLASSLEGGRCGEECRRALLRLFYFFV